MHLILFDMMDTLVREPYPSALDRLFKNQEQKELFFSSKSRQAAHAFERGEISEAEFFRNFYDPDLELEKLKKLPKAAKVKKALLARMHYMSGMAEILEGLQKQTQVRTGIASNYSEWYENILDQLPKLKNCDYLFFSCEMGVRKPQRQYYEMIQQALLKENGLISEPSQILFIDDRQVNIEGARSLSWQSHLMRNAYETQQAIENFIG